MLIAYLYAAPTEITDQQLLELGDQLWAADSEMFGTSELVLDVNDESR